MSLNFNNPLNFTNPLNMDDELITSKVNELSQKLFEKKVDTGYTTINTDDYEILIKGRFSEEKGNVPKANA